MFLSHPYKILFLIRHKDKKDLTRVQFKNSGRSGVQTAESLSPLFFFLSPPKKRGQTKKSEDIAALLSKRLQLPQAVVGDTLVCRYYSAREKKNQEAWALFLRFL